jgi:hypothetical protein
MDYRQRVQTGAIVLAALCAQYTTILTMALPTPSSKAHWTDLEVTELINYLNIHRSEGEQGNFKVSTYVGAAAHISPHLVHGPPKTNKMCKTKWSLVSVYLLIAFISI